MIHSSIDSSYGEPPLDSAPTQARPGTPEKAEVMADRYGRKVHIHHPGDPKLARPKVLYVPEVPERDRYVEPKEEEDD